VLTSQTLNLESSSKLYFKCENFQKTGSFKIRGATNAILQLNKKQLKNGIITTSSGNHGAAVSYSAKNMGISACVIMPKNTTPNKIENVKRYGGEIVFLRTKY
jgi:threonine dehydratase